MIPEKWAKCADPLEHCTDLATHLPSLISLLAHGRGESIIIFFELFSRTRVNANVPISVA
jgi:hypothetical protein